jgi:hypothetical protein
MSTESSSQTPPAATDYVARPSKRSKRLKFAVWYLALTQLGIAAVFYPFLRAGLPQDQIATADIVFFLMFALIAYVLYGAWRHRSWARYPLLLMLIVSFLLGVGDVLELN